MANLPPKSFLLALPFLLTQHSFHGPQIDPYRPPVMNELTIASACAG